MSAIERIGQSIKNIEANYGELFDDSAFNNGGVDEYTVTTHKKLLQEIIELFKAIAESPDLLSREFSTNEMNRIADLADNLVSDQYNGSILNDDSNRALISRVRVVFGEKVAQQRQSKVDELQELMVRVQDMLKKEKRVSSMKGDIEGISAKLGNITEIQKQAQEGLKSIQDRIAEVVNTFQNVNPKYKEIEEKRSAIVAFFGEIMKNQENMQELEKQNSEFLQKMKGSEEEYEKKREENLQELQAKNVEFSEKLENDYAEYLKKRGEMVKIAEGMLGLANAAELSDAFNQRIDKAKEKLRWPWVGGAIFFIIVTMGIAAALYYYNKETEITLTGTLARMSITAVPLLAAWFCGVQYLNLERTLEDYQYKKALAQSMPAFMEQLGKDNMEYRAYLFLVFQQMLQDPLRKKHDVPSPLKDLFDKMLEKFSKSITSENAPENKDGKP